MELETGTRWGKFTIQAKLGAGGTARVYKAYDDERGAEVAIKIVPEDLDERTLKRFVAETKILARLSHPNVVTIYDVGQLEGTHFYVMEYVDSTPLNRLIERRCKTDSGFFNSSELLSIFADIASALHYTHAQHIFHRDIKPGNILVDKEFKATLVDFGIAKTTVNSVHTETGSLLGTPLYMSPEQLQGLSADQLSDIYSLGLVIYQMTTGSMPFESNNPYTSATRRLTEDVPPPSTINPTIDPSLEKILLRCLKRDKKQRFQSAKTLLLELQTVSNFPAHKRIVSEDDQAANTPTLETPNDRDTTSISTVARTAGWFGTAIAGAAFALACTYAISWMMRVPDITYRYGALRIRPSATSATVSCSTTPALRCEVLFHKHGDRTTHWMTVSSDYEQEHVGQLLALEPSSAYSYTIRFVDERGRLIETSEREFTTLSRD